MSAKILENASMPQLMITINTANYTAITLIEKHMVYLKTHFVIRKINQ